MEDIYDPYSVFDKSNQIHPSVVIYPNVKIGKNNKIGPFAIIGSPGEIRNTAGKSFDGFVEIGDNNIISELVTIQRPLEKGRKTKVGNNNIIMAHSHIGHDAVIENNVEISTGTIVGGYALIKSGAKLKLSTTIRNRKIVAENAVVGMGSVVVKDVEANDVVVGVPAKKIR